MEHNTPHEAHGGNKPTYNLIFGVLAVLTVIEVGFAELGVAEGLHVAVLMGLATLKAGLVVAYYMHLKYDPPIFTWVFVVPVLMGIAVVISLVGALNGYDLQP